MKTLNEQIERLRELVRKCYATVAVKNGTVPEVGERNMENLPDAIASTHDTLEELTITQNGEYTPQEGVAGFSKVTAEFDTSSLPKVKVSQFGVTDACINDDGICKWGNFIDTKCLNTLRDAFNGCTKLKHIDVSNWDVAHIKDFMRIFQNCSIEELDVSKWDTGSAEIFWYSFFGCKFRTIDVSNWNTANVTQMRSMFRNCSNLEYLDTTNWEAENFDYNNGIAEIFMGSSKLTSIVGNRSIEDVIDNNIKCFSQLKYSVPSSSFSSTNLDRASLRALINGLADLTGQTAQTLTLGATLLAKLTEEDIAIGVNKNWTIV